MRIGISVQDGIFFSYLVADDAPAITNGFTAAFGGIFRRVMCWAHMIRKVDDRLSRISDKGYCFELNITVELLLRDH